MLSYYHSGQILKILNEYLPKTNTVEELVSLNNLGCIICEEDGFYQLSNN